MKLVLFFFISMSVQASSYQVYCSNSQGTISAHSGHYQNGISYSRSYEEDKNERKVKRVSLVSEENYGKYEVEYIDEKTINENSYNSCKDGDSFGFSSYDKSYLVTILIKKKDGTKFPEGTLNLSREGDVVSARLFCEKSISNMTSCQ